MQIARHVAGEVFDAALTVASERDPDVRFNELKGAFPLIKEDTWQEVGQQPHPSLAVKLHQIGGPTCGPPGHVSAVCSSPGCM